MKFHQDSEGGGIADRPGDMADVFHTLFGIAGKLCSLIIWLQQFLLRLILMGLFSYR